MDPVHFPEVNLVLAKGQPEYRPLPVMIGNDGIVISLWRLSDEEIEVIKETKQVWLSQLTFGQPLQPQLPSVDCPITISED